MCDCKVLVEAAQAAKKNTHSPYSNFRVGAAVVTSSGDLYTGTNIENASYGLSVCAERVAIWKAISEGEKSIDAIAISCPPSKNMATMMPCGACLQVLSEFSHSETKIIVEGVGEFELNELLNKPFSLRD